MANLDQLQIEISASSKDAKSAIDGLVSSLNRLNSQLGLKNGAKLTSILNSLSKSATAFSVAANNVNGQGFDKAAQSASKAAKATAEFKKQAEEAQKTLSGLGNFKIEIPKELQSGTNSSLKGIQNFSFISDIKEVKNAMPLFSDLKESLEGIHTPEIDEYFNEAANTVTTKLLPAVINTDKAIGKMADFSQVTHNDPLGNLVTQATKATSAIEDATKAAREFNKTISDMESGKIDFNKEEYDKAIIGYNKASEAVSNYKKTLVGGKQTKDSSIDGIARIVALSHSLKEVSEIFGKLSNKATTLFKVMLTPLKLASSEYIEKFKSMADAVGNFQNKFKAQMKKVSDFWKKTMRTFTFMIVRKAFTAVLKEIGTAVQSLALYSNMMGTAFNTDLSNMVADFQYLGRSIVSVFAPLLNIIAPIIDAIVAKIATLLSYIGMLIAALGGSSSFTKAKKNVGNYAESLDKASKSAKNLTMGIDELNILADKSGSGSAKPYDGWEDAWEQVEIPDWIKNFADKLKNMFKDLFEPIKKAWDKTKQYVLAGWNYMCREMSKLLSSVWRDFIRVWKSDTVVHIFENLFKIIGDIEYTVGNLARNFRLAWDEGEKGYKIFKNIADIIDILVQHVRNVTQYMTTWSDKLDFNPLLKSVVRLTRALKRLADFIGGVFEDVMKNVILKYITFLTEEGIPHLLNTMSEITDAFNFKKIRKDFELVEKAFEHLLEKLDIGKTEAIGNLGKQIADFANSEEFTKFLQRLADIMDLISAKDVEKILTGIGQGILKVADGLVKFVNSESFMAFLEDIDEWLSNASSEDIANILEKIAKAILLFKFGEFAADKLSGFSQFVTILLAFKKAEGISTQLTAIGKALGVAGTGAEVAGASSAGAAGGFSALATSIIPVILVVTLVIGAIYSLVESFGGLDGFLMRIRKSFESVTKVLGDFADALGFDKALDNLNRSFDRLGDKLGKQTSLWEMLIKAMELVAIATYGVLIPQIEALTIAFSVVIDIVSTLADVLGGIADIIYGIFTLDYDKIKEGGARIGTAIVEGVANISNDVVQPIEDALKGSFKPAIDKLPEDLDGDISNSASSIADKFTLHYQTSTNEKADFLKQLNNEMLIKGLSGAEEIDYDTPSQAFVTGQYTALQGIIQNKDFSSLGREWNSKASEALKNSGDLFNTANEETSKEGADIFSQTYLDFLTSQTQMGEGLSTYGQESGQQLVEGLNMGIESYMSSSQPIINSWFTQLNEAIHNNSAMPFGSPNRKTLEYGRDTVEGFNRGITENAKSSDVAIQSWFTSISNSIQINIAMLGTTITEYLSTFMETYIFPFMGADKWSPLFDNLMNSVFEPQFQTFITWFDDSMQVWWEDSVLKWFKSDKWDQDIFTPLKENIQDHWEKFSSWWDTTMLAWWENQVVPWFEKERWTEQFNHIYDVTKEVFELIKEEIKDRMEEAARAVDDSCREMKSSLEDILELFDNLKEKLSGLKGANITFNVQGFASGGYVSTGQLFVANEAGAELVGTVGNRTAVASNQEITGIADAVYDTGNQEAQLLSSLLAVTRMLLDKDPVVIGDKDIARMANNGQNQLGMSLIH